MGICQCFKRFPFSIMITTNRLMWVYLTQSVSKLTLKHFLMHCNTHLDNSNAFTWILGDFNLGMINFTAINQSELEKCLGNILIDFISVNYLCQHNTITYNCSKFLDIVLTNVRECIVLEADALSPVDLYHPPYKVTSSKAFNMVDHDILIKKLLFNGISGSVSTWF